MTTNLLFAWLESEDDLSSFTQFARILARGDIRPSALEVIGREPGECFAQSEEVVGDTPRQRRNPEFAGDHGGSARRHGRERGGSTPRLCVVGVQCPVACNSLPRLVPPPQVAWPSPSANEVPRDDWHAG